MLKPTIVKLIHLSLKRIQKIFTSLQFCTITETIKLPEWKFWRIGRNTVMVKSRDFRDRKSCEYLTNKKIDGNIIKQLENAVRYMDKYNITSWILVSNKHHDVNIILTISSCCCYWYHHYSVISISMLFRKY